MGVPSHAASRVVLDVTDHGADPTGRRDSGPALRSALRAASVSPDPVTVVLPRGVYHVHPHGVEERTLFVSNTVGDDVRYARKRIALLLEDARDAVIDGRGSLLLLHGPQMQLGVLRSRDVTWRDMRSDWVSPAVLDLTVVATGVDTAGGFRDVLVPAGVVVLTRGDEVLGFAGERSPVTGEPYWYQGIEELRASHHQVRDLATGWTVRGSDLFRETRSCELLPTRAGQAQRIRLHLGADGPEAGCDPGGLWRTHQFRRTVRDVPSILVWESERTALRDLELHHLHGFGIVAQHTRDVLLKDVRFRAAEGTWRQSSSAADHLQFSAVSGMVQVLDCEFDNPHDDPINVHGTYLQVHAVEHDAGMLEVRYMHPETAGFPAYRPGDTVRLVDRRTLLPVPGPELHVRSVDQPSGQEAGPSLRRVRVRLTGPVPAAASPGRHVLENRSQAPRVRILGTVMRGVPTRGVLLTTPGASLIADNDLRQIAMAPVEIAGDARGWYESGAVEQVEVRDNLVGPLLPGVPVVHVTPTTAELVAGRFVHGTVEVTGTTLLAPTAPLVTARSVARLEVTGATVTLPAVPVSPAAPAAHEPDVRCEHVGSLRTEPVRRRSGPPPGWSRDLVRWTGTDFVAAPGDPDAWIGTAAGDEVIVELSGSVHWAVRVNGARAALGPPGPGRAGRLVLRLSPGPTVVEIDRLGSDQDGAPGSGDATVLACSRWMLMRLLPPWAHAR